MYHEMLNILDKSLHDGVPDSISVDLWPGIYKELRNHTVHCLIASKIKYVSMADRNTYLTAVAHNIQNFHIIMAEQAKVIKCLEMENIATIILKGAAAAMYYPKPEYRCMGDIDILVDPKDFKKAYYVLKAAGYINEQSLDNYHRHIVFKQDNIEIELHKFYSTSDNKVYNNILNKLVYEGITKRKYANIQGYSFPVLPWLENGLVLLSHINHHLSSGLGLRQVIDWMCYVEKELTDDKWTIFCPIVEKVGFKQLALSTTAMCKKYLGLTGIAWCNDVDTKVCDDLMDYILSCGNFGRKVQTNEINTISVIRRIRNPIKGIKYAQRCGCQTWALLKKCSLLKPFAWIYQLIRWAKNGYIHGVSMKDIAKYNNLERTETQLFERLGITKYR